MIEQTAVIMSASGFIAEVSEGVPVLSGGAFSTCRVYLAGFMNFVIICSV
jgi:hypothetical protein